MFELIARIRSRPVEYRRRVAFFTACGITLFIVALWLVSFLVGSSDGATSPQSTDAPGPFEALWAPTKESIGSLGDIFKGFRN